MELKEGTDVVSSTGQHVGKINRFVLRPGINELTHIVVQKGWLLPEDKVIPMQMIGSASEDQVVLKEDINFDELLPFEERDYIEVEEDILTAGYPVYRFSPAYYWYPPSGYIGYPALGAEYYGWPPMETVRNIPEGTIPLKEGAEVIGADGESAGQIERILVDESTHRTTHFIVSSGTLFEGPKLIPAHWLSSVEEHQVHISVPSRLLERLPDYLP
jgi:uncharacterized protein YrrD